jgi:hypothetical protein
MAHKNNRPAIGAAPHRQAAQGAASARQRAAVMRAQRMRADARRRLWLPLASVGVVVAVVLGLIALSLMSGRATASEGGTPPGVVAAVTSVPLTTLARVGGGQSATALQPTDSRSSLTVGGKPEIVFVSEESCPFCAAERWPLVVALAHFGTWSNLGATTSSATDIYPNTSTFSFRNATYRSKVLTLRTTELADNTGHALQPETALDAELLGRYDVPPYVNSAAQSGAVPFLDIDNRDILAGAQYDPQVLAGLSMRQIATQLNDPASAVARAIDGSAEVLIKAIDQILPVSHRAS